MFRRYTCSRLRLGEANGLGNTTDQIPTTSIEPAERHSTADGPLLAPAVGRVKAVARRAPRAVTADRGYGEAKVDADLTWLGARFVAIVRKGRPSAARAAHERRPRFRNLVKWRTGSEGRISALKHNWGWSRSLMDGLDGTKVWCGYGVFAHNSQRISGLIAAKQGPTGHRPPRKAPPRATGTGPPPRPQPPPALPLSA
jgi:transposase, IS5 family